MPNIYGIPNEDTSTEDLDRLPSDFKLNESAGDLPDAEPINGEQSQKSSAWRNSITFATLQAIVVGTLTAAGLLAFQSEVTQTTILMRSDTSTIKTEYYRLTISFASRTGSAHWLKSSRKK